MVRPPGRRSPPRRGRAGTPRPAGPAWRRRAVRQGSRHGGTTAACPSQHATPVRITWRCHHPERSRDGPDDAAATSTPAGSRRPGANARFDEEEGRCQPFVEGLRCRECARRYPAEALHVCEWCFGPLEVVYDYEAIAASIIAGSGRRRAAHHLALRRPAAGVAGWRGRPGRRLHPPGAGRPAGRRARPRRAVGQERHPQPHRFVQGPGRLGGAHQGPGARLQGRLVRLDRQPGQLGGRPRRPGRDAVGGVHPRPTSSRPRWSPRPCSAASWSLSTATTTTSTGCAPSWPASTPTGRSSTSTSGPTTPRAPRPWPSRWPSSWAGRPPTTWWCRSPRAASCARSPRASRSCTRSGCSTPGARCGSRAPRPTAAHRWPPPSPRGPISCGRSSRRPSPSRSPSATRPTGSTPSTSCGRRAAPSHRSPTPRSSTPSGCWPAPRGSSPRPPAGSPSPRWPSWPPRAWSARTSGWWPTSPATGSRPSTPSPPGAGPRRPSPRPSRRSTPRSTRKRC